MDAHPPLTLIHLVPPGGGGVDRCVRDLLARSVHDVVVHTTGDACVLERQARSPRFTPCRTADLARHVAQGGVGRSLVLVAHGTVPALRQACAALQAACAAPLLVALHDVWFADPEVGEAERGERLAFVRGAAARFAPSMHIVELARATLGEAVGCTLLPWGAAPFADPGDVPWSDAAEAACGERGFDGVVIGALGAHKGLARLEAVVRALPPALRLVVVGYTEHQLRQGWSVDGRLWVHGIFDPDQLPTLLQRYRPRLAFFAPGVPESHCYALSDAWMCGLPVLGPDRGAIGERVRRHGGGELYDPALDDAALAARLAERLQSPPPATLARPLPTMEETMSGLERLATQAGPATVPDDPAREPLQRLAAAHLDGRFYRREVTDLQAACERLEGELAEARRRLESDAHEVQALRAELQGWRQRHERLVARAQGLLGWVPAGLRERLRARVRAWRDR